MKITLFNTDPHAERFPAGHTVFSEGETGEHMFAVINGTVEIAIDGKVVELIGAGGVFGEMALVEDRPRIATAIVRADADLVRIDKKRFLFLVQETPFFSLQLMGVMAERLRLMNNKL